MNCDFGQWSLLQELSVDIYILRTTVACMWEQQRSAPWPSTAVTMATTSWEKPQERALLMEPGLDSNLIADVWTAHLNAY